MRYNAGQADGWPGRGAARRGAADLISCAHLGDLWRAGRVCAGQWFAPGGPACSSVDAAWGRAVRQAHMGFALYLGGVVSLLEPSWGCPEDCLSGTAASWRGFERLSEARGTARANGALRAELGVCALFRLLTLFAALLTAIAWWVKQPLEEVWVAGCTEGVR